ncbi:MAG: hypothetical protein WCF16_04135 [Alphaproteobacteria bacterium]
MTKDEIAVVTLRYRRSEIALVKRSGGADIMVKVKFVMAAFHALMVRSFTEDFDIEGHGPSSNGRTSPMPILGHISSTSVPLSGHCGANTICCPANGHFFLDQGRSNLARKLPLGSV